MLLRGEGKGGRGADWTRCAPPPLSIDLRREGKLEQGQSHICGARSCAGGTLAASPTGSFVYKTASVVYPTFCQLLGGTFPGIGSHGAAIACKTAASEAGRGLLVPFPFPGALRLAQRDVITAREQAANSLINRGTFTFQHPRLPFPSLSFSFCYSGHCNHQRPTRTPATAIRAWADRCDSCGANNASKLGAHANRPSIPTPPPQRPPLKDSRTPPKASGPLPQPRAAIGEPRHRHTAAMATAAQAAELKQQGAFEAARDPQSEVTAQDAEKLAVREAQKGGSAAFHFDPNASVEEKRELARSVRSPYI